MNHTILQTDFYKYEPKIKLKINKMKKEISEGIKNLSIYY